MIGGMSTAVRDLIASFDALSDAEKREVADAIASRVGTTAVDDEPDPHLESVASAKLAGIRLDKARLKRLAHTSPPPASWYEDDTRCW